MCGCFYIRGHGGIGRRARFRFWCPRRAGSSPVARIKKRCIVILTEFTISFVNIGLYGTTEMTTVLSYDKKSAIMPDVVWNISEE